MGHPLHILRCAATPGLAALLLFAACSSSDRAGGGGGGGDGGDLTAATAPDPGPGASPDAATPAPDRCATAPPPAGWTYPAGPYGVRVGDTFADFTLKDCDGQLIRFGDVLASADVVLLNIGAGWCTECRKEAPMLEAGYFRKYCERGFRLVQVLFEDADVEPATRLFCRRWKEEFGLTMPVLIDPLFTTEPLVGDGGVPVNLVIDPGGKILIRKHGEIPENLEEIVGPLLRSGP